MLKNELDPVRELVESVVMQMHEDLPSGHNENDELYLTVVKTFHALRRAWNNAAFSTPDDLCLKRYFSFHLEGVRENLDVLHLSKETNQLTTLLNNELLALIQYQRQYFGDYFSLNAVAPFAFSDNILATISDAVGRVSVCLDEKAIDRSLSLCLLNYFDQMRPAPGVRFTYHALFYYQGLIHDLDSICDIGPVSGRNERIVAKLTSLNFNSVGFFLYLEDSIRKSIENVPLSERCQILTGDQ